MSRKPVSLTVHKSNIERRQRKGVQQDMVSGARRMAQDKNIVAYAIVGLSDDGRAFAHWDTGGAIPLWSFPQTVAEVLRADIDASGIAEDFRKPVLDRAWKGSK